MPSPEPLDAGPALIRASNAVGDVYEEVAQALGLTVHQARILFAIARRPTNMLGLGSVLGRGKSTMTGVVARMETAGWVTRSPDPADRRHLVVAPTERGAELATEVEARMRERVEALLQTMDAADRRAMARILSSVVARAEELHPAE